MEIWFTHQFDMCWDEIRYSIVVSFQKIKILLCGKFEFSSFLYFHLFIHFRCSFITTRIRIMFLISCVSWCLLLESKGKKTWIKTFFKIIVILSRRKSVMEKMNRRMNEWMDEWMNEWMCPKKKKKIQSVLI